MADLEKRLLMASPSNLWSRIDFLRDISMKEVYNSILLTSPIRSTLQSGLPVKSNLATITKINEAVKSKLDGNLHMISLNDS